MCLLASPVIDEDTNMHQYLVACVVRHAVGVHESRIRQVSLSQLLIAVLWTRI